MPGPLCVGLLATRVKRATQGIGIDLGISRTCLINKTLSQSVTQSKCSSSCVTAQRHRRAMQQGVRRGGGILHLDGPNLLFSIAALKSLQKRDNGHLSKRTTAAVI